MPQDANLRAVTPIRRKQTLIWMTQSAQSGHAHLHRSRDYRAAVGSLALLVWDLGQNYSLTY